MVRNMGVLEQLTSKTFPEAVEAGSFGTDVTKFVSFKAHAQKGVDQFNSNVVFGDVTLEQRTGQRIIESVVIKTRRIPELKGVVDSNVLFHNEVLFYTKIIPCLQTYDKNGFLTTCFSEFVYGKVTNNERPEEDVVILKNLNQKGFKVSDERLYLDEKHTNLVLDRLAKFHALSLAYQMDDPEGFNTLVSQIKQLDVDNLIGNILPEELFKNGLRRGVEPLKDDPKYKDRLPALCANFENALEHWKKFILPSDRLTVISHGDFHRNNVMFKYEANGDPIEMVFFDFQAIKVSSPTIDTSVFLSLNVAPEVRSSHWDEFLRTYYGAMSRQLEGYEKKPSFDTVDLDLREKGIYGYYVASLMGPMMVALIHGEEIPGANVDVTGLTEEEIKEMMQKFMDPQNEGMGGGKATEMVVGLVKHMIDKNYIF